MIPQSYHTFWRFFGDLCPTEQIAGHVLSKRDASQGPTLEHHPQPRIFWHENCQIFGSRHWTAAGMCRKSPAISRVPIGRTLHLWHLQYGIYGISSQAHGKKERKPQLSLWRQAIPVDDVGQRQLMAAWSCYETQKIQTTLSTPGKWWVSSHVIIVITTCQVFLRPVVHYENLNCTELFDFETIHFQRWWSAVINGLWLSHCSWEVRHAYIFTRGAFLRQTWVPGLWSEGSLGGSSCLQSG